LLAGAVAGLVGIPEALAQDQEAEGPGRWDLVDRMVSQDLVVVGRLSSVEPVQRFHHVEGCSGPTSSTSFQLFDLTITVDSVLIGVAEDSVLVITTTYGDWYARDTLVPGARVLAWGNRLCPDGWRLYGNAYAILDSGELAPSVRYGLSRYAWLRGQAKGGPISYAEVRRRFEAARSEHPATWIDGASGLALVRAVEVRELADWAKEYQLEHLRWLAGEPGVPPVTLRVKERAYCLGIAPGDTLVVPVPAGAGPDIDLPVCPRGLEVKEGFLAVLGVPLGFLAYGVDTTGAVLRLKPYLAKE
jgi:hypothetical protein